MLLMRFVLVVMLAACTESEAPSPDAEPVTSHADVVYGTVYTCPAPEKPGAVTEWCWTADPYELGQLIGTGNCYPTQGVPQCSYACPSSADCIAFNGCYCP